MRAHLWTTHGKKLFLLLLASTQRVWPHLVPTERPRQSKPVGSARPPQRPIAPRMSGLLCPTEVVVHVYNLCFVHFIGFIVEVIHDRTYFSVFGRPHVIELLSQRGQVLKQANGNGPVEGLDGLL